MSSHITIPWRSPGIVSALLLVTFLCPPGAWAGAPSLRSLSGIVSVTVLEQTDTLASHVFALGADTDPRLLSVIPGGPNAASRDFIGARDEFYDIYLSDVSGNLDAGGGYVSIVCQFAPVSDVGNNIDAIALDFNSRPAVYADDVGSVQTSSGLTDPALCHAGFALRALGAPDVSSTRLSQGGLSRLTVGFANAPASRLLSTALLRIAGGAQAAGPDDARRGDLVAGGGCEFTLNVVDAVVAARLAASLSTPLSRNRP